MTLKKRVFNSTFGFADARKLLLVANHILLLCVFVQRSNILCSHVKTPVCVQKPKIWAELHRRARNCAALCSFVDSMAHYRNAVRLWSSMGQAWEIYWFADVLGLGL